MNDTRSSICITKFEEFAERLAAAVRKKGIPATVEPLYNVTVPHGGNNYGIAMDVRQSFKKNAGAYK